MAHLLHRARRRSPSPPLPTATGAKALVAQAACVGMHLLMNVKFCYIYVLTGASDGPWLWV
jgi:hypothetical protein